MANHMFHISDGHGYSMGVIECPFPLYSEGADDCVYHAVKREKGSYVAKHSAYDYCEIDGMEDVTDDVRFLGYFDQLCQSGSF